MLPAKPDLVDTVTLRSRSPGRVRRGRAVLRIASAMGRGNAGFCLAVLRPDISARDAETLLSVAPGDDGTLLDPIAWVIRIGSWPAHSLHH